SRRLSFPRELGLPLALRRYPPPLAGLPRAIFQSRPCSPFGGKTDRCFRQALVRLRIPAPVLPATPVQGARSTQNAGRESARFVHRRGESRYQKASARTRGTGLPRFPESNFRRISVPCAPALQAGPGSDDTNPRRHGRGPSRQADRQAAHPGRRLACREGPRPRSEEHTSELQSRVDLVCRLLLEKKKLR